MKENIKLLIDMDEKEAKEFFLEGKNYCNLDLPKYFNFDNMLKDVDKRLKDYSYNATKKFSDVMNRDMLRNTEPNYKIFANKDGELDWRPYQLIHPLLYYYLITVITEENNWNELKNILKNRQYEKIKCISMPKKSLTQKNDKEETILNWWEEIEQETIKLSLDYEYCLHLDITNCYGSVYTHTISWAIHGKDTAKSNKKNKKIKLLGNIIDGLIQDMSSGQTNGIPQGSVLTDFLAEIILSYSDKLLKEKLEDKKIENYKILRYRDDYRIFSNSSREIKIISKCLSEILLELNFKLNTNKTLLTTDIILDGIKPGKLEYQKLKSILFSFNLDIENNSKGLCFKYNYSIQKHLLEILIFSKKYKNSSRITVALKDLYVTRIEKLNRRPTDLEQIVSILIEIIVKNPNTIGVGVVILSKLLFFLKEENNNDKIFNYIDKLIDKINKIPNTDYINIWLQRLTIKLDRNRVYNTHLCQKIYNNSTELFDTTWISLRKIKVDEKLIIDEEEIEKLPEIISIEETSIFNYH